MVIVKELVTAIIHFFKCYDNNILLSFYQSNALRMLNAIKKLTACIFFFSRTVLLLQNLV